MAAVKTEIDEPSEVEDTKPVLDGEEEAVAGERGNTGEPTVEIKKKKKKKKKKKASQFPYVSVSTHMALHVCFRMIMVPTCVCVCFPCKGFLAYEGFF